MAFQQKLMLDIEINKSNQKIKKIPIIKIALERKLLEAITDFEVKVLANNVKKED